MNLSSFYNIMWIYVDAKDFDSYYDMNNFIFNSFVVYKRLKTLKKP